MNDLVNGLSDLERQLLTGTAPSWGSWMFEVGADLVAKGLGRRDGRGSIYFDTPLAIETRAALRASVNYRRRRIMAEPTELDVMIGTLKGLSPTEPKTVANGALRKSFEAAGLIRSEPHGKGFVSYLTPKGEAETALWISMGGGLYISREEADRLSAIALEHEESRYGR